VGWESRQLAASNITSNKRGSERRKMEASDSRRRRRNEARFDKKDEAMRDVLGAKRGP
jgi:hypothetical protein